MDGKIQQFPLEQRSENLRQLKFDSLFREAVFFVFSGVGRA